MGTNEKRKGRIAYQLFLIVVVLLVCVGGVTGYVLYASQPIRTLGVFKGVDGKERARFSLEVRASCEGRQEGLMFRKPESLGKGEGMLFIFPKQTVQRFWMRNTLIPLDMIFIDRARKVVGVVADVPPLNEVSRSVEQPSVYVVEVHAGIARAAGINIGDEISFDDELPVAEECR